MKAETPEQRFARLDQLCKQATQEGFQLNTLIPASPAEIRACLAAGDSHLNNIALHHWDRNAKVLMDAQFGYVPTSGLYTGKKVGYSLSDCGGMLKHYAANYYVNEDEDKNE